MEKNKMGTNYNKGQVEKALNGKKSDNAQFVKKKGSHTRYIFYYEGKKTANWTYVSNGSGKKKIDNYLINQMSKQLHLSKDDFCEYIDCKTKCRDLAIIWKRKGILQ